MPFGLWRKPYTIRRFEPSEVLGGFSVPNGYKDVTIGLDIQIAKCETVADEDGEHVLQKLEAFADDEIRTVDEEGQRAADWLWFQGKWHECRSSVLLSNTILAHYECEFIQCLHQEDPPGRSAV